MIFLDNRLDPAEVSRLSNTDLISATHTSLDYYLFCGDIYFRINDVGFDALWGWIPVINFSTQLCEIVCTLKDGETGRLEFTESDNEIRLSRIKDVIEVSCDYAEGRAQTYVSDLRGASISFASKVFDDLIERWPLLKSNKAFQEKVERFVGYSEHCD